MTMVMIMSIRTSRTYILSGAWNLFRWITSSCLYTCTADVTKEASVISHGRTLRIFSNIRCRVFGMDTSVLVPTPSPWYRIESLGENSLFLG